ncbi:hypothetical protein GCM10023238_13130 [Streptomyces heliomycini]
MPVHGEWRHLRANAELGRPDGRPARPHRHREDGVAVDLVEGKAKISGKVQAGYVYVDGPLRRRRRRAGPQGPQDPR